jgi:hypothetical protein
MSLAFETLTHNFNVLKLQISVQFKHNVRLPEYKGSMLHGWFGQALKSHNSTAYQVLFAINDSQSHPKPYLICPNEDHKQDLKKGEILSFELSLLGDAVALADDVIDALRYCKRYGFGEDRHDMEITSIASVTPFGLRAGIHIYSLNDWIVHSGFDARNDDNKEIALHFLTPTLLKKRSENNRALSIKEDELSLFDISNAVLRRLTQLSSFWLVDDQQLISAVYDQRPTVFDCETDRHLHFEDWQRHSIKHNKKLPFGGLKGQISFYGKVNHLIPLLKVGEILHIGSKTTFGLGKYQLIG